MRNHREQSYRRWLTYFRVEVVLSTIASSIIFGVVMIGAFSCNQKGAGAMAQVPQRKDAGLPNPEREALPRPNPLRQPTTLTPPEGPNTPVPGLNAPSTIPPATTPPERP